MHEQLISALSSARAEMTTWRASNYTGRPLSPEKREEAAALNAKIKEAALQLGKAVVGALDLPPLNFSRDGRQITISLPVEVLNELLIGWEAGLSDDEHFVLIGNQLTANCESNDTTHAQTLMTAIELRKFF